ncbi:RimK/LysX family protein [Subsaxibacter sp. CAU 1640]|uniref:ATP-dependent zinc protease family protein n=1 Tax=Subsaxibacter sp. CAU 1640 TaxID=2933271 RepID=UPI002002A061|nr:RimK/LysX family protein [Subsaxibacter sp. CAU 1640]MCK7589727.1 RimK/LysX family protein [Subsaxibacter sp. CAU 1640]
MPKKVIGRIDKADFPTLDLFDIDIKIDTGAYTSSIHCHKVIVIDDELVCLFYDEGHPYYNGKEIRFKQFSTAKVKSSNGLVQKRYKVKTSIVLFEKKYNISLTLSTRDDMRYPILIGRKFLSKKFVVDVTQKNISYNKKNK